MQRGALPGNTDQCDVVFIAQGLYKANQAPGPVRKGYALQISPMSGGMTLTSVMDELEGWQAETIL